MPPAHFFGQLQAIHPRHLVVGGDAIGLIGYGHIERRRRITGNGDAIAMNLEDSFEQVGNVFVTIDYRDRKHAIKLSYIRRKQLTAGI